MLLLWRQGFIKSQQCLTSGNRFARLVGLPSACCRGIASSPSSGKCYFERRLLKFTVDEVFDVVADVSNYKHFVPWCKDSTMISTDANSKMMRAELLVGYGIFNQKYVSEIELTRPSTIKVFSKETKLFEFLNTEWKFTPSQTKTHCWVTFQTQFSFKSQLYNNASDMFLREVAQNMILAFERRCVAIYGTSKSTHGKDHNC